VRRNWTGKPPREKIPKGKKVRSVPMAPAVVDELAQLKEREHFTADDDLVFVSTLGRHLDGWAFRRRWNRAIRTAGLRRLRFHDLRHTFGSHVVRQLDQHTLQSLMGHQHYSTTAGISTTGRGPRTRKRSVGLSAALATTPAPKHPQTRSPLRIATAPNSAALSPRLGGRHPLVIRTPEQAVGLPIEAAQPGLAIANSAGASSGSAYYLQPGSVTVWPGGWHFAPGSFGPLLLLPGPKSGSAKAGAAEIERAATASIDASALRRIRPPPCGIAQLSPSTAPGGGAIL
jgi:integrase-like protein